MFAPLNASTLEICDACNMRNVLDVSKLRVELIFTRFYLFVQFVCGTNWNLFYGNVSFSFGWSLVTWRSVFGMDFNLSHRDLDFERWLEILKKFCSFKVVLKTNKKKSHFGVLVKLQAQNDCRECLRAIDGVQINKQTNSSLT